MEFDEFARRVDERIAGVPAKQFAQSSPTSAGWESGARSAHIELVPPRNFSLTLVQSAAEPARTWYPVDQALVELTAQKIALHLRS